MAKVGIECSVGIFTRLLSSADFISFFCFILGSHSRFYVVSAYHLLKHEMALFRVDWLLVPFFVLGGVGSSEGYRSVRALFSVIFRLL